jgi:hypothetical protein
MKLMSETDVDDIDGVYIIYIYMYICIYEVGVADIGDDVM